MVNPLIGLTASSRPLSRPHTRPLAPSRVPTRVLLRPLPPLLRYVESLRDLFEEFKGNEPGYENVELVIQ